MNTITKSNLMRGVDLAYMSQLQSILREAMAGPGAETTENATCWLALRLMVSQYSFMAQGHMLRDDSSHCK